MTEFLGGEQNHSPRVGLFMKRGPQPKRLFNAAQCRARAKLAQSIARVVNDPNLRARLESQAAKQRARADMLEAQAAVTSGGPMTV
jgi:hypothetical protein